jgi:methylisocitrate lyase
MGAAAAPVEEFVEPSRVIATFCARLQAGRMTRLECARNQQMEKERMTIQTSAGRRLRDALRIEQPLQIVGAINAYSAMLAQRCGYEALYLSGAGVANASYGLPDLGMTSLDDVLEDVRRITAASTLPLLVDIDTGWGGAFNIARSIQAMTRAGAAAVHIEDQVAQKRCGHRPNKAIVPIDEMNDRIKAAVDAKLDADFIVMARTDALAVDGFNAVLDRVASFVEAGADAIFAEAMTDLQMYAKVVRAVDVPVLANITEFGQTPLFTTEELGSVGIAMALYPLSAFRAMSLAALNVYKAIRADGTQKNVVPAMQTRTDLYEFLGYHEYERKLDELFKNEESREAN